jgi:hypothetical protein
VYGGTVPVARRTVSTTALAMLLAKLLNSDAMTPVQRTVTINDQNDI